MWDMCSAPHPRYHHLKFSHKESELFTVILEGYVKHGSCVQQCIAISRSVHCPPGEGGQGVRVCMYSCVCVCVCACVCVGGVSALQNVVLVVFPL